jgi:glutathione S-transferase
MATCTLYHFPFSLFSIMVRYAIALRGESDGQEVEVEERVVNLNKNEHLSEWYLTEINPKGQVRLIG